jgi:hypothetical protein
LISAGSRVSKVRRDADPIGIRCAGTATGSFGSGPGLCRRRCGGEALANLVQPFWMLPILGLFKLGARDVMGYTAVVFLALTPVVLILVTVLGPTLPYPL